MGKKMMPRRAAWLILGVMVVAVEPPEGCPANMWTSSCSGGATCESLAIAGLTCSSVAVIDNCKDVCAEPCCITTTSTTFTSTMTTVTHTETTFTITETETHTTSTTGTTSHTDTMTTTTVTTATQTYTGSTVTHTHTNTVTMTTEPESTSSVEGAAAKVTVTMAVKVEENAEGYMEDSRVQKAYKDLMVEITGLDAEMIDVQMAPDPAEEGEITVTYLLTVPYEDKGNGLEPVVSITSLQSKLAQLNMAGLNEMLDQKMEAAGVTNFGQEVQRVDDDQTTAVDGVMRLGLSMLTMVLGAFLLLV